MKPVQNKSVGLADDIFAPSVSEIGNVFALRKKIFEFQQKSCCVEHELVKINLEIILTVLEKES